MVAAAPAPSPGEFQRFLSWLDDGVESDGERYVEMRRRLVSYFKRKRCLSPDDLADETLTRVARKLEEQGAITETTPARYCYVVARFVFLEYVRAADRRQMSLDETRTAPDTTALVRLGEEDPAAVDALLDTLERCLQQLTPSDRALILDYYAGDDRDRIARRRALAARLRLTPNAVTIRACRIRDKLEACVTVRSSAT